MKTRPTYADLRTAVVLRHAARARHAMSRREPDPAGRQAQRDAGDAIMATAMHVAGRIDAAAFAVAVARGEAMPVADAVRLYA